MRLAYAIIFPLISALMACSNGKKKKDSDTTTSSENQISSVTDTLTFQYDSVKVYSENPISANKQITDTAKASFSYPVFANAKLNTLVEERALLTSNPDDRKYTSYKDLATSFINEFEAYRDKNKENDPIWFKDVNIQVLPQWKGYLGLKYTFSEYVGGAHMNTMVVFRNYNPQDLSVLNLDDIIQSEKMNELVDIAEKIFRKNEGLTADAPLDGNYFFENGKFVLNDNFYLTKEGICFLYNSYEIKAYAYGRTELLIPYSSIQHILASKAPLP